MEWREWLLGARQSIEMRTGKAHARFSLLYQILINQGSASGPQWGCRAGAADSDIAAGWTARSRNCTEDGVTSRRISIGRYIGHLALAIAEIVLYARRALPFGQGEDAAQAAAAASTFGAALRISRIAPHRLAAIGAVAGLQICATNSGNKGIACWRI